MLPDRMVTIGQIQREARERLASAGIESAALDARLIIQHALGLNHEALIAEPDRPVELAEGAAVNASLERRLGHEPMSRIIGEREFYGRNFIITPDVLDPRPDTETLIDKVLEIVRLREPRSDRLRIADIGTGSGAIIVTLLAELAGATGTATDISPLALAVARVNAKEMAVEERVEFEQTSWLDTLTGTYDVIVSNPPYIETKAIRLLAPEVAQFDPLISLDGGHDGLAAYRAIVAQAFARLERGGHLCLEIGVGQTDAVLELIIAAGFAGCGADSRRSPDLSGRVRVVTVRKP